MVFRLFRRKPRSFGRKLLTRGLTLTALGVTVRILSLHTFFAQTCFIDAIQFALESNSLLLVTNDLRMHKASVLFAFHLIQMFSFLRECTTSKRPRLVTRLP